jgi:hypothetical protein
MPDQTIIEQHLKQLREHVDNAAAVCNDFEQQMLPPDGFKMNQDRYMTDFPTVVPGSINEF